MPNVFSPEGGAKSPQLQASTAQTNNSQKQNSTEKNTEPSIRHSDNLPSLLKKGVDQFTEEKDKDLFLYSALTACSGLLTKVSGFYKREQVYSNLFLLVVGPPASGKSAMMHAKRIVSKVHDNKYQASLLANREYKSALSRRNRNELVPEKPLFNVVFLPANCSSSKFINHLADNQKGDCPSILIESELDTLNIAQSNEWGNFSDILRKTFHNEAISKSRSTNDEYEEVSSPKLAVALSGTMNQFKKFINNSEDGLYSRFMVHTIDGGNTWADVSPCDNCPNLTEVFTEQASEYYDFWEYISKDALEVELTKEQWSFLNTHFGENLREISEQGNPDCTSLVIRHGVVAFKMCMVLTAFRKFEDRGTSTKMVCRQEDFETALSLVDQSLKNSLELFEELPGASKHPPQASTTLYDRLPPTFSYTQAIILGRSLDIQERTVERYLKSMVKSREVIRTGRGMYQKPNVGMTDDGSNI